ncbi:hypothetical protein D3C77_617290 [compost metagenome]
MLGAGIAIFVNTVAEAHNFLPILQLLLNVRLGLIQCADFAEHTHNRFVRSAMQRPLQGANCRSDTGINIG